MSKSDTGPIQNSPNDSGDGTEQRQYQFGGDYVISSSASAGAWVSATYPVDLTEAR
jgi:hypothetical protein